MTVMTFVSNVANEVAQRLPPSLSSFPATIHEQYSVKVPRNLDLTYITERILAMSKPAEAAVPTRNDIGRAAEGSQQESHHDKVHQPQHSPIRPKAGGVNAGALSTYLTKRHGTNFVAFNLSEEDPDDRTLLLLNRQILRCGWSSPCIQKSETPCLPHILDICYAIHAFLALDNRNITVVYCANGRTRTAIVIACYLKFSHAVTTSLEGFRLFLSKRCPHLDPNATLNNIPSSLVTFFRNFDNCIQLGTVLNPKPLLLRAIAIQGVPVDDKPCIDIWDSQQQHVYASNDDDTMSQWADEEGFYRVNRVLEGDFVLLCRFGGPYMDETNDPSKVLFRYANTTGFLASGPYELPKTKVDMMRRYVQSFDEEDFSLTLLMESYWDCTDEEHKKQMEQVCDSTVMPPVLAGRNAKEKGWHLITEQHAARPEPQDIEALTRTFPELQESPPHLCKLALQLTNFNFKSARNMLFTGSMKSWWRDESMSKRTMEGGGKPPRSPDRPRIVTPIPDKGCLDILRILDEVDGISTTESKNDSGVRDGDFATTRPQQSQQDDPLLLYKPILFPNRGDIVDSFGDYYKQIYSQSVRMRREQPRRPLELGCRPTMPLIARKRIRYHDAEGSQKRPHFDPFLDIGGFRNPNGANGDLAYDEDFMAAMELYEQINHTGVSLKDLRQLQASSREWNGLQQSPTEEAGPDEKRQKRLSTTVVVGSEYTERELVGWPEEQHFSVALPSSSFGATGASVAPGEPSSASIKDSSTAQLERHEDSKTGTEKWDGAVSSTKSHGKSKADTEKGNGDDATGEENDPTDDIPLKLDPEYAKV